MDELKLLTQLLQTNQQVAEAVAQMVAQRQQSDRDKQWVSLEDGAAALGSAFSSQKLREDIKEGWLKHGIHYIDTSHGSRPHYAVCVVALRKLYSTPPDRRKPA